MKIQTAVLVFTLSVPFFSQARETCAFGSSTADLAEEFDKNSGAKDWYKGEHISLSNERRLKGLSDTEKQMILIAKDAESVSKAEQAKALKDFSASGGYIIYFSHDTSDREFVMVVSYPGDNEHGLILEIKKLRGGDRYKIISTVAVIGDGDFEDCEVLKGSL